MKTLKTALTIFLFLFLVGCSKNDSFLAQKQACFKYKASLEKENNYTNFDPESTKIVSEQSVGKVFYSRKLDTCLYTIYRNNQSDELGRSDSMGLYNLLTGEEIVHEEGGSKLRYKQDGYDARLIFEAEVKKYE